MKNSCTLSRAALVVPSGTDWRSRCEGKFRQGLGNPLADYSHGSGLGSRTSSILARVCSCFVSATPPREWKDRDASRSPSCVMPLPMAGKSNPSSPCASKSVLSIDNREPSSAKTHAASFSSPAAWLKPASSGAYLSPSFVLPVLEDSGTHFGLEIGIVSPDGVGDLLSTPFQPIRLFGIALQFAVDQSHRESLA